MATEIIMPKFGLSMEEGTIGQWLVKEGDTVKRGDPIAEVSSEKLNNEAVSPEDGVILKLLLGEGDTLPCGSPIAVLGAPGETYGGASAPAALDASQPVAAAAPTAPPPVAAQMGGSPAQQGEVKITPRAKKLADAKGLSFAHIRGTGLHGFITIDDLKREGRPLSEAPAVPAVPVPAPAFVQAVPAAAPVQAFTPAAAGETVVQMSPMQSAVSKHMYASMQNAAQTTMMTEANVRNLVGVYTELKEKYAVSGVKLTYTAMLIKAVAMALESHPDMRMRIVDENHYTVMQRYDVGVAVDVPDGLIVPVVRGANLKDLRTICAELADLAARARAGILLEEEMGGGVITVTNLGMFGVTHFTPILNEPEPCILGVGSIVEKPVVREGGIFADPVLHLSLTHDHRITNGAPVARFLQDVVANLDSFKWI